MRSRVALFAGVAAAALSLAPASWAAPTAVSIEFDDGIREQATTRSMLAAHGMHGTFCINSGKIGTSSYYMTWDGWRTSTPMATRSAATAPTTPA